MEAYIREQYEYAVNQARFGLQSMYDELAIMEVNVLERMSQEYFYKKIKIKDALIYNESPYPETTNTWDNSLESNIGELIVSLIFLPLIPFMRKSLDRDDLRKCCNSLVCQVKRKHGEVVSELRRRSIEDGNFMVSSLAIRR